MAVLGRRGAAPRRHRDDDSGSHLPHDRRRCAGRRADILPRRTRVGAGRGLRLRLHPASVRRAPLGQASPGRRHAADEDQRRGPHRSVCRHHYSCRP